MQHRVLLLLARASPLFGDIHRKGAILKPASFKYYAPRLFEEAVQLMAAHADEARPLAGGQSLVALMNTRLLQPSILIDLGHIAGLDRIIENDDGIAFSAMVRQADAEHNSLVHKHAPLVAAALPYVGSTAHRNRGTICGSLAHSDPVAELPCVAVALDAIFTIAGSAGRRKVPASEFFFGPLSTALEPDELLEAVFFPRAEPNSYAAFFEVRRNQLHGFAIVGAGAQLAFGEHGECSGARIAVMGVDDIPVRLADVENALIGEKLSKSLIASLGDLCGIESEVRSDIHASAAYRREMVRTLVLRALNDIATRQGGRRGHAD